jgi:2-methylisocitrate lyase-like PEP mutase family enzyme
MEMVTGRISPTGGKAGHTHGQMVMPSQATVDAIDAATDAATLQAALIAWFAENGLTPSPPSM